MGVLADSCSPQILDFLEAAIIKNYNTFTLESSLPAVFLYGHRGYKTTRYGIYELADDVKLVYEIIEKTLN